MMPLPDNYASFDAPVAYRIVVRGMLARDLSDRLEGMEISRTVNDDGATVSILVGELADQSALAGVLNSLYELHVALIAVEQIPPGELGSRPARSGPEA